MPEINALLIKITQIKPILQSAFLNLYNLSQVLNKNENTYLSIQDEQALKSLSEIPNSYLTAFGIVAVDLQNKRILIKPNQFNTFLSIKNIVEQTADFETGLKGLSTEFKQYFNQLKLDVNKILEEKNNNLTERLKVNDSFFEKFLKVMPQNKKVSGKMKDILKKSGIYTYVRSDLTISIKTYPFCVFFSIEPERNLGASPLNTSTMSLNKVEEQITLANIDLPTSPELITFSNLDFSPSPTSATASNKEEEPITLANLDLPTSPELITFSNLDFSPSPTSATASNEEEEPITLANLDISLSPTHTKTSSPAQAPEAVNASTPDIPSQISFRKRNPTIDECLKDDTVVKVIEIVEDLARRPGYKNKKQIIHRVTDRTSPTIHTDYKPNPLERFAYDDDKTEVPVGSIIIVQKYKPNVRRYNYLEYCGDQTINRAVITKNKIEKDKFRERQRLKNQTQAEQMQEQTISNNSELPPINGKIDIEGPRKKRKITVETNTKNSIVNIIDDASADGLNIPLSIREATVKECLEDPNVNLVIQILQGKENNLVYRYYYKNNTQYNQVISEGFKSKLFYDRDDFCEWVPIGSVCVKCSRRTYHRQYLENEIIDHPLITWNTAKFRNKRIGNFSANDSETAQVFENDAGKNEEISNISEINHFVSTQVMVPSVPSEPIQATSQNDPTVASDQTGVELAPTNVDGEPDFSSPISANSWASFFSSFTDGDANAQHNKNAMEINEGPDI